MIKLKEIEKYYSSGFIKTFVLRNISLDIEEGEVLNNNGTLRCREVNSVKYYWNAG